MITFQKFFFTVGILIFIFIAFKIGYSHGFDDSTKKAHDAIQVYLLPRLNKECTAKMQNVLDTCNNYYQQQISTPHNCIELPGTQNGPFSQILCR